MALDGNDQSHLAIGDNVQQAYLVRLKDAAKRLRQIERDHIDKIGKLYGVAGETKLPEASDLDRGLDLAIDQEPEQIEEMKQATDP